jgi:hypothetical protein
MELWPKKIAETEKWLAETTLDSYLPKPTQPELCEMNEEESLEEAPDNFSDDQKPTPAELFAQKTDRMRYDIHNWTAQIAEIDGQTKKLVPRSPQCISLRHKRAEILKQIRTAQEWLKTATIESEFQTQCISPELYEDEFRNESDPHPEQPPPPQITADDLISEQTRRIWVVDVLIPDEILIEMKDEMRQIADFSPKYIRDLEE